ncbi:MAG TPA: protein kinase [Planctomycetota bacterium]|nr:protein kinase [Planctomycetota bacterium]
MTRPSRRESTSVFDRPGENIGGFVVRGEIGRGGAGRVVEAIDPRLRRRVALKHLLPERSHDQLARRRFVEEAQIAGRLEHPGILPVYHLGLAGDGSEFFCMKLASGRDLGQVLERWHRAGGAAEGFTLPRLIAIFERVVEAVGYAHDRGVIHRDLKPSNVMIGDHGEVWLLDWGLAKMQDQADVTPARGLLGAKVSPVLTAAGLAVGTPCYMAPEQARGEGADASSDIFGLGGILYQILTGRPPFAGRDARSVMTSAADGRITPLRASAGGRRAPRGLVAICMRCMAYERQDRYADAGELLADLRAYGAGEALVAAPDGPLRRVGRWLMRRRAVMAWSGAAAAALLVTIAVASAMVAAKDREALRFAERAASAEASRQLIQDEVAARAQRRVEAFAPYAAAMDLIGRGQLADEAVVLLERALAIDQRFPEAHYALGEARRMRGDLASAADAWLEADRLTLELGGEQHAQALLSSAFALDRIGAYERADVAFARLAQADAKHPLVQVGGAYRALRRGAIAEALAAARAAHAAAPHLWETHLALGEMLLAASASGVVRRGAEVDAQALACLRRAHVLAPGQAEACSALAQALAGLADDDARREAGELVERAIALEPGNGARWLMRSGARSRAGDAAGAASDLEQARRCGASEALLLYHRAVLAAETGATEEACGLFADHATRFRGWPPHVGTWMSLASALDRLDEPQTRQRFERWCEDNPTYALVHLLRGRDRLRHDDPAGAAASAQAGLALAPYDHGLRLLDARCRLRARDATGAERLAADVIAEAPGSVEAWRIRVVALATLGRSADALAALDRAGLPPEEQRRLRQALSGDGARAP